MEISPSEFGDMAGIYCNIIYFNRNLSSLSASEDEKIHAAEMLIYNHLPKYREFPQEIRDELRVNVESLERKAKKFLDEVGEEKLRKREEQRRKEGLQIQEYIKKNS